MTIYSPEGNIIHEAPVLSSAAIRCELMGDFYIELPFETEEYIDFPRGSFIPYKGRKFNIMDDVVPELNAPARGYRYSLKFWGQQHLMKHRRLFWLNTSNAEAVFSDTTTLKSFATLVADNMNDYEGHGTISWRVGLIPEDKAEVTANIKFSGSSCWDAINDIAKAFDVEWWVDDNFFQSTINFGKCELGEAIALRAGEIIKNLPASKGVSSNYGTRFYVFGGVKNIPSDYLETSQGGVTNHISEKRLHLPNGKKYIDAWENIAPNDIVEQVVFFDDIYPKNTETITSVEIIDREIVEGETNKAYILVCNDTPFVPDDIMEGETLAGVFTSGSLEGREFELQINKDKWDKKFEIVASVEFAGETSVIIPNEYLYPKAGDTFILTGVKLPEERIAAAEGELLVAGNKHADKNSRDTDVYDCPTNPVYCFDNDISLSLGQKVILHGEQFGEEGRESRIQGYEKVLDQEYEATYSVGDNQKRRWRNLLNGADVSVLDYEKQPTIYPLIHHLISQSPTGQAVKRLSSTVEQTQQSVNNVQLVNIELLAKVNSLSADIGIVKQLDNYNIVKCNNIVASINDVISRVKPLEATLLTLQADANTEGSILNIVTEATGWKDITN